MSDARAELLAVAAATSAANSTGYQYTLSRVTASGETEAYVFGAVVTGDAGGSSLTTMWIADVEGVYESWVPAGTAGTNFRRYDVWKEYDAGRLPRKVVAVVDREVAAAGGSDSSLVIAERYDSEGWAAALERNADGEPGFWVTKAVGRLDPGTVVTKTKTAQGSVFTYTEDGDESQILVSAGGLIEGFDGEVGWLAPGAEMRMDARGAQVVVPEGVAAAVSTRAPEQAVAYVDERRQLRYAVQGLSGKAKAIAARKGSRVTKGVLARAVARMRGFEYPEFRKFRAVEQRTGFLLVTKSKTDYSLFGDVCATVSAGKTKPRVVYC